MSLLSFYEQLTKAELRVLPYCLTDLTCQEIADKLNLNVETVKTHRKNIARKGGVEGKSGLRMLLRRVEREGLI